MPKAQVTCNNLLNIIYRAVAWAGICDNAAASPLTAVLIALATGSYTPTSNAAANETAYTNYARQSVARTTGGWTAPASGQIANASDINFPQCGVTGSTITSACTCKAAGASEILHYGDLNSPIAVSNQIQPRFPAGALTITEA